MKFKYSILFLFLIFIVNKKTNAQTPNWAWAKAIGGSGYEYTAFNAALDASGNVYTAGTFEGTVDFDPGPGIFLLTASASHDIFITKLDPSGNFVWAKQIGGTNFCFAFSLAVDASGNVYTTGQFTGSIDFDPGVGTFTMNSPSSDMFISKLDAAGNFVWAKSLHVTSGYNIGYYVGTDPSGNVYATGNFTGTSDFDPGTGIFGMTSSGSNDIFITKLDSDGNFLWAKKLGGTSYENSTEMAFDASGNAYITGQFSGTADFDPGTGTYNLTATDSNDIFICKLDAAGNFAWAKQIGGTGNDVAFAIALDASHHVYTTGYFSGTVDFDPGAGIFNLNTTYRGIFISKLDEFGNFVWAKSIGGTGDNEGFAITLDPTGNIYTGGYFSGTVDFDPDASATYNLTSAGSHDLFVSKLDASANFVWAKSTGGTGDEEVYALAIDSVQNIFLTGEFKSHSLPFSATTLVNASVSDTPDVFIARLDAVTGIENLEADNGISIFPNPASGYFSIAATNGEISSIKISDLTGKIIYSTITNGSSNIIIDTKDFPTGFYFVQIQLGEFRETRKLIISK